MRRVAENLEVKDEKVKWEGEKMTNMTSTRRRVVRTE